MESKERELTRKYVIERLREISKILTDIVKTDIKNGKLKNINPNLVIMAFNGMLRDIIYGCITENKVDLKPEEMADAVIQIIFDGISKNK